MPDNYFPNHLDDEFDFHKSMDVLSKLLKVPLKEEPANVHRIIFTEDEIYNYLLPAMRLYHMVKNDDYL